MARMSSILLACLLILSFLCSVPPGLAEEMRPGSFRIHPFVSGSVGYTDNVFLTESGEESDTFFLFSPGIKLIVPFERVLFDLDYTLDYYSYSEWNEADRAVHTARGTVDLKPWRSLDIRIKDTFTRGEDPPNLKGDRTSPFVWNSPGVDVSYDLSGRVALGAGYEYVSKSYDRSADQIDDFQENGLSARVYYRILPKTSLVVGYWYRARDYDERPLNKSDSNRVEGGITWKAGAKTVGTARVGYMETDFDKLNRTDSALSYSLDVTHRLRPKTTVALKGAREILNTSAADRNLTFSNSYLSTQIAGTLTHRYRKLTGRLTLGYIRDEYLYDDIASGEKRKDDLFRAEFGLEHALRKWLRIGASYRYIRLNSNFKASEYTENAFLGYVSLVF